MTIERLDSAMGGLTQALANLGGAVANVTEAAGGLTQSLSGVGSQGALAGIGGADGSDGKGGLLQKIQRLIDALAGANQGGAARQGDAAKPDGAGASPEAGAPDAAGGRGKSNIALQILQMVLDGLKSGQLTEEQAGQLLAQVGQLMQGGGSGAIGESVAGPQPS